jgi:hypothetical protein
MPEISEADLKALQDQAKAGARYQALYDGLLPKYTAMEASAGKVAALEEQIAGYKTRELDQTFAAQGITDPKVRRIFELEHGDVVAPEGKEKPAIGEWLTSLRTQADLPAHLKPFLPPAGAPAPAAPPPPRTPAGLPDPNKGAKDMAAGGSQFSAQNIDAMTLDQFRANAAAIAASNPALAGITNAPALNQK